MAARIGWLWQSFLYHYPSRQPLELWHIRSEREIPFGTSPRSITPPWEQSPERTASARTSRWGWARVFAYPPRTNIANPLGPNSTLVKPLICRTRCRVLLRHLIMHSPTARQLCEPRLPIAVQDIGEAARAVEGSTARASQGTYSRNMVYVCLILPGRKHAWGLPYQEANYDPATWCSSIPTGGEYRMSASISGTADSFMPQRADGASQSIL